MHKYHMIGLQKVFKNHFFKSISVLFWLSDFISLNYFIIPKCNDENQNVSFDMYDIKKEIVNHLKAKI